LLSRFRGGRVTKSIAAAPVPVTPANSTYGSRLPVTLYVNAEDGTRLARVEGTLQFDDGKTKYAYSLTVCRYSSLSAPDVKVFVNDAYYDLLPWFVYSGFEAMFTGEVNYGARLMNVSLQLVGSSFSPRNGYTVHYDSVNYENPYI
jgi:hypothetical protein